MPLTLALAQIDFTVGDIAGNVNRIAGAHAKAAKAGADLVIFSEMAITGYPPEDLVLRRGFQDAAMDALDSLAALTQKGPAIILGGLWCENHALHNAVFLLEGGKLARRQYKRHLPNYGVFDEKRVFRAGDLPMVCAFRGARLGLLICEDMWTPEVAAHLKGHGAELLICINASPYEMVKARTRREVAQARVKETGLPLIYVNQIGGQDELVFDGRSFALSPQGEVRARLKAFEEDFALLTFDKGAGGWDAKPATVEAPMDDQETVYRAMVLGLRDYVEKNRFKGVVLGLSGGIDSALTAAVAVDALGAARVHGLMMPSPFTSRESVEDATACAKMLGIRLDTIAITPAMEAYDAMFAKRFAGKPKGTTEENIQARIRGNLLMAISNKEDLMVLTTGNKSEMSVGYATLYGDMCGGYSVLKDVYKTTVYKVSAWRNAKGEVIPPRVFTKAPTAELRANQTDQDSLPPYELLDAILIGLIEEQLSVDEVVAKGHAREVVERVARMVYGAEYKRRQAPPGVKVTGMSFGRDRRYPITSGWEEVVAILVRFAPSPTGYLHVGNVRTALVNWLFAKKTGGRFLLRLDDTDKERSRAEYAAAIEEDLRWLGITWDAFARQSDRMENYEAARQKLVAAGRLYACYETPEELEIRRKLQASRGLPPIYDRASLQLTAEQKATYAAGGRKPHWRFLLESKPIVWNDLIRGEVKFEGAHVSDPVLVREDGVPLYTFASVVDDGEMGATHIIRGEDHVSNSAVQTQIFEALGFKAPQFAHLALLRTREGELSKRVGGNDIRTLRDVGLEPMAVNSLLAKLGTSDPVEALPDMDALVAGFSFRKFGRAPANYDAAELEKLNERLLHQLPFDKVKDRLAYTNEHFWLAVRANIRRIAEVRQWWDIVHGDIPNRKGAGTAEYLSAALELLPPEPWGENTWGEWTRALGAKTGLKGKELFLPLRLALTGMEQGPEMKALLPLIGRNKVAARLR